MHPFPRKRLDTITSENVGRAIGDLVTAEKSVQNITAAEVVEYLIGHKPTERLVRRAEERMA
jgi:hypothetical protein